MERLNQTLVSVCMTFLLAFTMLGIAPMQALAADDSETLMADVNEDGGYVYDDVYGLNDGYAAMVKKITTDDGAAATQTDIVKSDGTVTARSIVSNAGAVVEGETDISLDAVSFGKADTVTFTDRATGLQGLLSYDGAVTLPAEYARISKWEMNGQSIVFATKSIAAEDSVSAQPQFQIDVLIDGSIAGSFVQNGQFTEMLYPTAILYADGVIEIVPVGGANNLGYYDIWVEIQGGELAQIDNVVKAEIDHATGGRSPWESYVLVTSVDEGALVEYRSSDGQRIRVFEGKLAGSLDQYGKPYDVLVSDGIVSVKPEEIPSENAENEWYCIDTHTGRSGYFSDAVERVGGYCFVRQVVEGVEVREIRDGIGADARVVVSDLPESAYVLGYGYGEFYGVIDSTNTVVYRPGESEPVGTLSGNHLYLDRFDPQSNCYYYHNNGWHFLDENLNELDVPFDTSLPYQGIDLVGTIDGDPLYVIRFGFYPDKTEGEMWVVDANAQPVVRGEYALTHASGGVTFSDGVVQRGDMYYATDANGNYGAIDAQGNVVIPFEYDGIEDMGEDNTDLILLKKGDAWYIYDTAAKEIVLPDSGEASDPDPGTDPDPDPDPDPEPTPDPDPTPVPDPEPDKEVVENPDGSTTTTVTETDGTVTVTVERPDGSVTEKVERPDGTVSTTETTASGVTGTIETDEDGAVTNVTATVPTEVVGTTEGPVELPIVDVPADGSLKVSVSAPAGTKVTVPVVTQVDEAGAPVVDPGLVVVVIAANGTETVLPKSAATEGGIIAELPGDCTVVVEDRSIDFPDVVGDEWYADQGVTDFMSSHGIMTGVDLSDGTTEFQGDAPLDRGMMATLLYRVQGQPEVAGEGSFDDVEDGVWYSDAIEWAADSGIVTGYDDTGEFCAQNPITREQVATMLFRYANELGLDTSARVDLSSTPDGAITSGFASEAMSWAVAEGLFRGNDETGVIRPLDGATRAEASVVIMRFVEYLVGA